MNAIRLAPLLLAAVTGCRTHAPEPVAEELDAASHVTEPAPPSPADPPPRPRGPHRRGLVGMIFHASHDLGLDPEQGQAVDRIEAELQGPEEGVKESLRAYETARVAGIRAGKIDVAALRKRYAALDEATRARQRAEAAVLNDLRALLGPAQSRSLVIAVRARRAAHSLRAPDEPSGAAGDWGQERLERLEQDCGLDADQTKQVAALLAASNLPTAAAQQARRDAANQRADALLVAFARDGFDAGAADLWLGVGASPHELIEREDAFLARLLPILRPDQRESLAVGRARPLPEDDAGVSL